MALATIYGAWCEACKDKTLRIVEEEEKAIEGVVWRVMRWWCLGCKRVVHETKDFVKEV